MAIGVVRGPLRCEGAVGVVKMSVCRGVVGGGGRGSVSRAMAMVRRVFLG